MKKNVLLLVFLFFRMVLVAIRGDDRIAEQIEILLVRSYGEYKDTTFLERIVLDLGKDTFVKSVETWRINYQNIDALEIKLHPQLKRLSEKIYRYETLETALKFENSLKDLTFLGFKNLDIYLKAVKEGNVCADMLTLEVLDSLVANPKFFLLKKELYKREEDLKKEIRGILASDKVKKHVGLYLFFFDFLNGIREKIIKKDLAKTYELIKLKQNKKNDELFP